eukprot:gene9262-9427_t
MRLRLHVCRLQLGNVHQAEGIPGFSSRAKQVTISSVTGFDRAMVRYKIECIGAPYTPNMHIINTTHVITTREACQQPSRKIAAAAQ